MPEFKVGDMVRCVNPGSHAGLELGKGYKVEYVPPFGDYLGLDGVAGGYDVDRFEAMLAAVSPDPAPTKSFKVGDRVKCVTPSIIQPFLVTGEIYVVTNTRPNRGSLLVQVEGSCTLWQADRFELASQQATVTPQPFDYPETDDDRDRAARAKLRAYKRGMRDWLYGTTSGEET